MPARPRPECVFYVRPERGSRLSVGVEVFRSADDMRRFCKREAQNLGIKRFRARGLLGECAGVTVRRGMRKTPLFALIRLNREYLGTSTITHEAFHATCRWVERRGMEAIPVAGRTSNITGRVSPKKLAQQSIEERAATVHDQLCRRIVDELHRRGFYQ